MQCVNDQISFFQKYNYKKWADLICKSGYFCDHSCQLLTDKV